MYIVEYAHLILFWLSLEVTKSALYLLPPQWSLDYLMSGIIIKSFDGAQVSKKCHLFSLPISMLHAMVISILDKHESRQIIILKAILMDLKNNNLLILII